MVEKVKSAVCRCFEGDLTMPKVNFWLIGAVCLLAGIVYGLLVAPATHGVTIGSNNGNQSGCVFGVRKEDEENENVIEE